MCECERVGKPSHSREKRRRRPAAWSRAALEEWRLPEEMLRPPSLPCFGGSAGEIRAASGSEGVGAVSVQFCLVARRPNFDFFFFDNNILAYEIKHFGIDGCPED